MATKAADGRGATGPRRWRPLVALVAVASLLAACGDGDPDPGRDPSAPAGSATPDQTEAATSEATGAPATGDPTPSSGPGSPTPAAPVVGAGSWSPIAPLPVAAGWRTLGGAWGADRFLVLGTAAAGSIELFAYDPTTDAWQARARLDADVSPWNVQVRWGGGRLFLLVAPPDDGSPEAASRERPLALYSWEAATDRWRPAPPAGLGERYGHSVTWTGEQLVVFGGIVDVAADDASTRNETLASGAAWDPASGTWVELGSFPHQGRSSHGAVWNGRRVVVFGGGHASGRFEAEGEYPWDGHASGAAAWDPATNAWTSIDGPGPIGPVVASTWTGDRIVWWDGSVEGADYDDVPGSGGIWDTNTGAVEPLAAPPLQMRRDEASAVWAPQRGAWITWGGSCGEGCNQSADDGAAWDAATNTWTVLAPAGLGRRAAPIAWTGRELVVVGGAVSDQEEQVFEDRQDGARWRP